MNDRKLKQLFHAARRSPAPAPGEGFDQLVMRAIRSEAQREATRPPAANSFCDQLNRLFPRLACAAVLVIAACGAVEWSSASTNASLTDSIAQISEQWLFAATGM